MKVYNTATRKKEKLKTIKPGEVGIYACGPTVYSAPHIGNMYAYICWDVLVRAWRYLGYRVKYVMNVTDIGHLVSDADEGEDKMEKKAREEGLTVRQIADKYEKQFFDDEAKLNIVRPDIVCRATDYIQDQIKLIQKIEQNGFTYRISDGIYFDTSRFSDYGTFARLDLQQLKEGARIGVNPEKKNQTDFALWKFSLSTNGLTRQMEWDSPWGRGVPGWHVECTAMSIKNLGLPFDVHVGGVDHIAVHHTNEIAQSYGAFGRQAVNYWLHNGFVTFKGEKVSKSKGGLWTITELEKMGFEPLAYRYLVLTSHYRSGLDFSLVNLKTAQTSLNKLRNLIKVKKGKFNKKYLACFKQFLENDLAMPEIIALVWQIVKEEPATVLEMDKVLGLNLAKNKAMNIPEEILELVNQRRQARAVKDWVKADKLREMIRVRGYDVEDTRNDCKIKKLMLI